MDFDVVIIALELPMFVDTSSTHVITLERKAEVKIAVKTLNRMNDLDRPVSVRGA